MSCTRIHEMEPSTGLTEFLDEVTRLIDGAERQYGIANRSYAEYVIERLEFCIITCTSLLDNIRQSSSILEMENYCSSLRDLVGCLRQIHHKWEEYASVLDSLPTRSEPAQRSQPDGPGRPRFEISKDQLEYLASLSFKWTEIAALLGVSRMTIYRFVAGIILYACVYVLLQSLSSRRRWGFAIVEGKGQRMKDAILGPKLVLILEDTGSVAPVEVDTNLG